MAIKDLLRSGLGSTPSLVLTGGLGAFGVVPPGALLETLADDFNDNSLNATLWTTANILGTGTVTETGGRLELAGTASNAGVNYGVLQSAATYDLTGSSVYVQVAQWEAAGANGDSGLVVMLNSNNRYEWFYNGTNVLCRKKVGGASTTLATNSWAALGGDGQFLRIAESGGVVTFDHSANGVTWTTVTSNPTSDFAVTAVTVEMNAGTFASVASPGKTIFDNVNTPLSGAAVLHRAGWRVIKPLRLKIRGR